jgi:phenylacetate-CoA ligase
VQTIEEQSVTDVSSPPLNAAERAALRSFRRAALSSRGYRAHLERLGVDHRSVSRLSQVPYTDKRSVFGDHLELWLDGGRVADAAELLTSSGQTGLFSVGVTSRSERRAQERTLDAALRQLGGGEQSPTLVLNCLPMGISIPTRLATVATPSVHVEMALEILARAGSGFDRVVIAAEPLFLKEMGETALREKGPGFADQVVACFVGGEWVAESWRRYVSELFGFPKDPGRRVGVLVSMGAAEVGLHVLHETPALREARRALDSPMARTALFGRDPGYSPTLLTWDPNRLYMEERRHSDGVSTLVLTALTRRLLPLVRYDLDDEAELLDAAAANRELMRQGSDARLEGPAVALWGRRGATIRGHGWSLRPEIVKEGLFATAAHAGALTGRFRIAADEGRPVLHVQLRAGVRPGPGIEAALRHTVSVAAGVPAEVRIHDYKGYPFHDGGDFQHKPLYLERAR